MNSLKRICRDIQSIKIQGATSIAKAALRAYQLKPSDQTKKMLIGLRPTEPMLVNTIHALGVHSSKEILDHFATAQAAINRYTFALIKPQTTIITHCHSTNVIKALLYTKKNRKNFSVMNTETRPLFQGRKTARELARAGIPITTFVDSAFESVIQSGDIVLIGCDAILSNGIINKIGSGSIATLAKLYKKPVYIIADSWKVSTHPVTLEERDFHEVWSRVPRHIRVRNPAFEYVPFKHITGIITEYGVLTPRQFMKKVSGRII